MWPSCIAPTTGLVRPVVKGDTWMKREARRTCGGGAERILGGGEGHGFGRRRAGRFGRRPGQRVAGAAGDARHLDAVQAVHRRRPLVHRRRAVALLAVVVVAPRVHLLAAQLSTITFSIHQVLETKATA